MKAVNMDGSDLHGVMQQIGQQARRAAAVLATVSDVQKQKALETAATALIAAESTVLDANKEDVAAAKQRGLSDAMIDRLVLTPSRILAMAEGLRTIALQEDPVGKVLSRTTRPNGLVITQLSVPLGVIGIIYESRPNVTADAGGLALKSGNAVILRGGSESFHSSKAIIACLHEGLRAAGIPETAIQLVPTRDREAVGIMLRMTEMIDVIIPRGGVTLTKRVSEESRVPTLLHLIGNCHTYIHQAADTAMATDVLLNAKMRRTGVCGATESLVIDAKIAGQLLPVLVEKLAAEGCTIKGDKRAQSLDNRIEAATEEDWYTEYLAPILSVKVTDTLEEAIAHINHYGSHHTDAIITRDEAAAAKFLREIDSAIVLHNTSTQFADGGEFGMGAEIGIATGRLHARGPVGAAQLTTYKYVVHGTGQVRPV